MESIIVKNIWKKFNIGNKKKQSALEKAISILSGKEQRKTIWVLKDISFKIKTGEIIGIVGENGSGKSTLLRIIAGIYKKDKGYIKTNGKIVSLIGLDTGLDLRLSAKDNIYLCCSILGLKQKEIKRKFKEIISFAELQNFVNTKLYQFSSGMISRLAFSISIHSIMHKGPKIILLDEVLATGDEHYKQKCIKKIKELSREGATVIMVSHDLHTIYKNCKRIIWMEYGRIIKDGNSKVLKEYIKNSSKYHNKI